MNIGFDLDKVLIDYPPLVSPNIIDKLYKKRDNGILVYKIPGPIEQKIRILSHSPILRPPIKDNMMFLKSIPTNKNRLFLVSSRFGFLKKRTELLIKKHGLDKIFDKMYFNFDNRQPHIFKNQVIAKLKLDIYVDDDLSLLKYVAAHNTKTRFFWLNYQGKKGKQAKNITAITNLKELFKLRN
jgi:hypothetical protein